MNISVFALVSSSLISTSPLYVGNKMSFSDCNFQKFTPLIFYHQQSLFLYNSNFQKGLNQIININGEVDESLFTQEPVSDTNHGN